MCLLVLSYHVDAEPCKVVLFWISMLQSVCASCRTALLEHEQLLLNGALLALAEPTLYCAVACSDVGCAYAGMELH